MALMHSIYTTPGFIIDSRPYGDAGKIFFIFTRDHGLVLATAQGIRYEKSKLRYHTQEYSFGTFSLVRGKEYWRLTGADENSATQSIEFKAKIASLLKRLLHGEEPHQELFENIQACNNFLAQSAEITDDQLKSLESLIVLRILHSLGYIGKAVDVDDLAKSNEITLALLDEVSSKRTLINQHINKALRESHL